jgi:hypothetical protein
MLISADQIVLHLVGDYVLQSDWMANEKTKKSLAAFAHAASYTLPFLLLTRSLLALAVIGGTHFVIDRWRLARYVVWAKNFFAPKGFWPPPWKDCTGTGYPPDRPAWLAVWLLIIADNTMHLVLNGLALRFL